MSNPIDGGPGGPLWADSVATDAAAEGSEVDATDAVEDAGFEAALADATAQISQAVGSSSLDGAEEVVLRVADRLRAGELADPAEAVNSVVEDLIDLRFVAMSEANRAQMKRDLLGTLLDDPYFVLEVEELISQAMDRL